MAKRKNPHAVALGRKGGRVTSAEKAAAARVNGRKGGRPKQKTDITRVVIRIPGLGVGRFKMRDGKILWPTQKGGRPPQGNRP